MRVNLNAKVARDSGELMSPDLKASIKHNSHTDLPTPCNANMQKAQLLPVFVVLPAPLYW